MNPLHRRLAAGMRTAAGGGGAGGGADGGVDLLDSLVAYWPMASGAVGVDVHGSFDLVKQNVVGTDSAPTGNGADFTSNNSYMQRNDSGLNQGSSSFTVSIWVKLHAYNSGQYGSWVVNRRDASPGGDQRGAWQLTQSSTAYALKFQYHYNTNADNVAAQLSPRLETNRWYHLVGGLDVTTNLLSLYIDGVLIDSVSVPSIAPGQNNVMLRFGQWSWNSPDRKVNWDGEMADCGYWIGRAPDQAMVDALYNNGNGLTYDKFTQAGGFVPTDIPDLTFWVRPSLAGSLYQDVAKTTPVTSNADPVGYAEDQSSAGCDVKAPAVSNKPTWDDTGRLVFSRSAGQYLRADANTPDTYSAGEFTVAVWVNLASNTGFHPIFFLTDQSTAVGGANVTFSFNIDGDTPRLITFGAGTDILLGPSLTTGVDHFVCGRFTTSGDMYLSVDNGAEVSLSGCAMNNRIGYLFFGAQMASPNRYFDGTIGNAYIFTRSLSPAEITSLYNYGP